MSIKNPPSLKEYYRIYYDSNYFRDLICIKDEKAFTTGERTKYNTDVYHYSNDKDFLNWILLRHKRGDGTLASSLTHFSNLQDYQTGDDSLRYSDRLFFDFDVEDTRAKALKEEIKNANLYKFGKERINSIKKSQKDFRKLILNDNLLEKPFNELQLMMYYMESQGMKPYPIFSGSKGFHLLIFFEPLQLENISEITTNLTSHLKDKLELDTLDLNVTDSLKRKKRVPYSKHERTMLYTTPFDRDLSYDELLKMIKRNTGKPQIFDKEEYIAPKSFTKDLILLNQDITRLELEKKEKIEELNKLENANRNHQYYTNNSVKRDSIFSDMRDLCKLLLGEPSHEYKKYNSYKCPFHNDNNPSALVYEKVFVCKACNLKLGYFEFIRKLFNLKTDDEVKQKMREILEKV